MPSTHRLQANFSNRIGQEIALPAGSKTMVFFGTSGDGIETNRVPGGLALTVSSGTPVHAANYVSVGHQPVGAPTRYDVIDTGNAKDATNFPLGHTWMCCARAQAEATNYVVCMGNQTASSGQGAYPDCVCLQQSTNRVINFVGGGNRGFIQLNNAVNTNWHFIGLTDTGGAAPSVYSYEFTENVNGQQTAVYNPTGRAAAPAMTTHFGSLSVDVASTIGPADIAWGFECSGVMTLANMAALAASVRPWLARRGIVA